VRKRVAAHDVPAQEVPRTQPISGETKVTEAASNPCGTGVLGDVVEVVKEVVVEVVGEFAKWVVLGTVGNGVAFGVPPPHPAATTRGRTTMPAMTRRRTPIMKSP
jgi:hypothetical protein